MRYFLIVVGFLISQSVFGLIPPAADSIGVERVGKVTFILHRVEAKETLYSLSRRYAVDVKTIAAHNPGVDHGLDIGQIVRIPIADSRVPVRPDGIVHTVKPKETLYSIARTYDVDTEEIKRWNHISTNILDIGQELKIYPELSAKRDQPAAAPVEITERHKTHTVKEGETLYAISREEEVPMDSLRRWNNLRTNDISIGDILIVGFGKSNAQHVTTIPEEPVASVSPEPEVIEDTDNSLRDQLPEVIDDTDNSLQDQLPEVVPADFSYDSAVVIPIETEEIFESGLAEVIEGSANNRKYLGLHRTVPVGTVMRVQNEMNGQEVFVRIIGKLPDTGANRNIVIKISHSAYEGLGAIDSRFRVTISYLP